MQQAVHACLRPIPDEAWQVMLQGWLEGKPGGSPVHCDVRDVAAAHICAAERSAASGRYIVSHASSSNPAEVGRWLQVMMLSIVAATLPRLPGMLHPMQRCCQVCGVGCDTSPA